jgi:lysyl-tRNA synthetase class 2
MMLEWYEINQNLDGLMTSTKNFLKLFLPDLKYTELELANAHFDNEPDFNQYFLNQIEPSLPPDTAVFISGYPAFLSPLAEPKPNAVNSFPEAFNVHRTLTSKEKLITSLRFELYINGIEIANACTENRDTSSIKSAFLAEQKYRQDNHLPTHPISHEFITNCGLLPPCSGIGLGLDRLLTIINSR